MSIVQVLYYFKNRHNIYIYLIYKFTNNSWKYIVIILLVLVINNELGLKVNYC